ncbi:hypothetical protein V5N11_001934 [Cardamine amara subsp. amara]|uniref:Uncharacterized protein n=1 Tax=Cardamine amara subsp. amara TaxID=228776 RepID=A0ABD1AJH8_CARAN
MRRGRGKGKKQNASAREEEEKIPSYRRRGRPQKPMKDDFEEEEEEEEEEEMVEKIEEEVDDDDTIISKDLKNERKRKIPNGSNTDINADENGLGSKSSTDDSTKSTSIGFRQNGSRRKSKPRRAAEAVVECNGI